MRIVLVADIRRVERYAFSRPTILEDRKDRWQDD
jgi:hypothetical protein